ncbi:MAG: MGH1-like glycoside hydrolase domain-containing protein [Elusimicrobiota bacterium]
MATRKKQAHRKDDEFARLLEVSQGKTDWNRWGPYLSERQWGTVREDYSEGGACWDYFPHEHARSRAYRWGEDGILGWTDRECLLCFAPALWNGKDPIIKERLFGLTNSEGNHGEDVKECYFYLDGTPTHSYMKALYRYPQAEFPYRRLIEENRRRGLSDPEFELSDAGVFKGGGFFDLLVEYAKDSPEDVLIRLTATNRGPKAAKLWVLPTIWFRNTWSWGKTQSEGEAQKPSISSAAFPETGGLLAEHQRLGRFRLLFDPGNDFPPSDFLFTENETNFKRLFSSSNAAPFVKDAFHDYLARGDKTAVNPQAFGTKAAALYALDLKPGQSAVLRLRLFPEEAPPAAPFGREFESIFTDRIAQADAFHAARSSPDLSAQEKAAARQARAGLLWSKQFYEYVVEEWLKGDPAQPPPPRARLGGRNQDWTHVFARDVLSMPDKWEYPWFASWDLAFHCVALADVDPDLAKSQLIRLLREWYMHPNGQIPAYEFAFSDANPPVHAWACWRVYQITAQTGDGDRLFLSRAFQKLLLNFTWWVNRKDVSGKNIFAGGFLGLDNISPFDRSQPLPGGGVFEEADGTAWMAFYCATMLAMALELAKVNPAYDDMASKFFEHFIAIADALNNLSGCGLWDEEDGFYYSHVQAEGREIPIKLRSMVGLIPLFAVQVIEDADLTRHPGFAKRLRWFLAHRQDLSGPISFLKRSSQPGNNKRLLAIPSEERLLRLLRYVFDEREFLSPFGVRSLSKIYQDKPFTLDLFGQRREVRYVPGESDSKLFGGNSNWRGPVWFPVNFLLVEALRSYHRFFGDALTVEFPTGSGRKITLDAAAQEISRRLVSLFLPDAHGSRPCHGNDARFADDPLWKDYVLFYEHFHGDTGRGLGASHQTGWTALTARLFAEASARK